MACLLHLRRAGRLALVCCIAICGCTPAVLAPDDLRQICQVAVNDKSDSSIFRANPLLGSAGGLVGAGQGALAGAIVLPGSLATVILAPLGAVFGAVEGGVCAAASASHPNAEADFETIVKTADAGSLMRALEADLKAPRAGCARIQAADSTAAAPDAIVEIEKVGVMMGCGSEKQDFYVGVNWRVMTPDTRRMLASTLTLCTQTSFKDADDWFADPVQARLEIERALTKTGQRMAAELLSSARPRKCEFRSSKTGEIEER